MQNQNTLYIGIDIAKYHLDIAFCINQQYHHRQCANHLPFEQVFIFLSQMVDHTRWHFILESTNIYWQTFAQYMHAQGFGVSVINPNFVYAYGKSLGIKNKSDKLDAKLLARYGEREQPNLWQPMPDIFAQLDAMNRQLLHAKKQCMREKIRLHTACTYQADFIKDSINYWQTHIKNLDNTIWQHINTHPLLTHRAKLLQGIYGIGKKTTPLLLALILPERFDTAKKLVSYVGLAPQQNSSGLTQKNTIIGHSGRRDIRQALYMPAVVVAFGKYRAYQAFVMRLLSKGKHKKQIIIAVMRKILTIAYAVICQNTPFDPNKHY